MNDTEALNWRVPAGLFRWKQHERILSVLMQLFCHYHDKVSVSQSVDHLISTQYSLYNSTVTMYLHMADKICKISDTRLIYFNATISKLKLKNHLFTESFFPLFPAWT